MTSWHCVCLCIHRTWQSSIQGWVTTLACLPAHARACQCTSSMQWSYSVLLAGVLTACLPCVASWGAHSLLACQDCTCLFICCQLPLHFQHAADLHPNLAGSCSLT